MNNNCHSTNIQNEYEEDNDVKKTKKYSSIQSDSVHDLILIASLCLIILSFLEYMNLIDNYTNMISSICTLGAMLGIYLIYSLKLLFSILKNHIQFQWKFTFKRTYLKKPITFLSVILINFLTIMCFISAKVNIVLIASSILLIWFNELNELNELNKSNNFNTMQIMGYDIYQFLYMNVIYYSMVKLINHVRYLFGSFMSLDFVIDHNSDISLKINGHFYKKIKSDEKIEYEQLKIYLFGFFTPSFMTLNIPLPHYSNHTNISDIEQQNDKKYRVFMSKFFVDIFAIPCYFLALVYLLMHTNAYEFERNICEFMIFLILIPVVEEFILFLIVFFSQKNKTIRKFNIENIDLIFLHQIIEMTRVSILGLGIVNFQIYYEMNHRGFYSNSDLIIIFGNTSMMILKYIIERKIALFATA